MHKSLEHLTSLEDLTIPCDRSMYALLAGTPSHYDSLPYEHHNRVMNTLCQQIWCAVSRASFYAGQLDRLASARESQSCSMFMDAPRILFSPTLSVACGQAH